MQPLDYGRSFLLGNGPENEVRFWVESRTRFIDEKNGRQEDYIQCGSCKSEHTFAAEGLFHADNYDFMPVFGPEWSVVFRRKARLEPGYKSCVTTQSLWNGQQHYLVEGKDVQLLQDTASIRQATYEWTPIVTQTEVFDEGTGQRMIIECPVKTMNTNREDDIYQVDTGPVAYWDLSQPWERAVDGLSLAFVAFNAPHFADFVVEAPTAVGAEQIYHYSALTSLPAENRVYAVL